jgi:competence protein ComGC
MQNQHAQPSPVSAPPPIPPQRTSGMAIASMILGIFSLIGGALLLIPPLLAVIFGHLSLSKCKKTPGLAGQGMGIAGLVMGYVSIPFAVVLFGLLSAMAIPAFHKVRTASQEKAIHNNLRMLSAAAEQHFLENGTTSASISDLVGPDKYIHELFIVTGENYPTQYTVGEPIVVTLPDGRVLQYP